MFVSTPVWIATIVLLLGLLAFDYFFHVRKAHIPSLKEAATWSAIYISIALLFGTCLWIFTPGHDLGLQWFSGYLTEEVLSIDNLFVFLILMGSFKVPRADQQKVLLFGITFALISRSVMIFVGAQLINRFSWIFYIFGAFLIFTAANLLKPQDEEEEGDNFIVRFFKKHLHTTSYYDGDKLFTMVDGKRAMTPMLLVMLAIGGTDLLFAFDSIPAIFGLTQEPYIVFTAMAFSLMGLRQLYFLIDGLLDRLIYLSYGLAAILGFIGVKLVLHALHENTIPIINGGQHVPVIEISTAFSLLFILGVLALVVVLSLFSGGGKARTAIKAAKRHVHHYLELDFDSYPNSRDDAYRKLLREEHIILNLPDKYKNLVAKERGLLRDLEEAHRTHHEYTDLRTDLYPDGYPLDDLPVLHIEDYPEPDPLITASRPPEPKTEA